MSQTQTFTVSGKAPLNPVTQVDLRVVSPPVRIRNISGTARDYSRRTTRTAFCRGRRGSQRLRARRPALHRTAAPAVGTGR